MDENITIPSALMVEISQTLNAVTAELMLAKNFDGGKSLIDANCVRRSLEVQRKIAGIWRGEQAGTARGRSEPMRELKIVDSIDDFMELTEVTDDEDGADPRLMAHCTNIEDDVKCGVYLTVPDAIALIGFLQEWVSEVTAQTEPPTGAE